MQNELKQMQECPSTLKQYYQRNQKPKRTSGQLSPSTEETTAKKSNMSTRSMSISNTNCQSLGGDPDTMPSTGTTPHIDIIGNISTSTGITDPSPTATLSPTTATITDQAALLKDIVGPLVNEVRDLKNSVKAKYTKLEGIITNRRPFTN